MLVQVDIQRQIGYVKTTYSVLYFHQLCDFSESEVAMRCMLVWRVTAHSVNIYILLDRFFTRLCVCMRRGVEWIRYGTFFDTFFIVMELCVWWLSKGVDLPKKWVTREIRQTEKCTENVMNIEMKTDENEHVQYMRECVSEAHSQSEHSGMWQFVCFPPTPDSISNETHFIYTNVATDFCWFWFWIFRVFLPLSLHVFEHHILVKANFELFCPLRLTSRNALHQYGLCDIHSAISHNSGEKKIR